VPPNPDFIFIPSVGGHVVLAETGELYIAGYCKISKLVDGLISDVTRPTWCDGRVEEGPAETMTVETVRAIGAAGGRVLFGEGCRVRQIEDGYVSLFAGNNSCRMSGDGGPATNGALNLPSALDFDAAGHLYINDGINCRIRKVVAGIITTVAGTDDCGQTNYFTGEGGPATSATLSRSTAMAVAPDGSVYFGDDVYCAVRRVDNGTGIITTVVGFPDFPPGCAPAPDGALGVGSTVYQPLGLHLESSGDLYIAERGRCAIRTLRDGVLGTVAGRGMYADGRCRSLGDGGPALSAYLEDPHGVAKDSEGNLYILERCRIRRVQNGIIDHFAGNGTCSYNGDGIDPKDAGIQPANISFDDRGNVYVTDAQNCRVRVISRGLIYTIAGRGSGHLLSTACGFSGEGGLAQQSLLHSPTDAVVRDGDLYIADAVNFRVRIVHDIDADSDGVPLGADNCPGVSNEAQVNTDLRIVLPPQPDDATWPDSDDLGDACDDDDDNDDLADAHEATAPPCASASAPTSATSADTDGDRYLDGSECLIGTDPASPLSRPNWSQCAAAFGASERSRDADGDGVKDLIEGCHYGSDPAQWNTDADLCGDGREAASVDTNMQVNAADLGRVASAFGAVPHPYAAVEQWRWAYDVDKNGAVNSSDLALVASLYGSCP
jgi:hypothetical protein